MECDINHQGLVVQRIVSLTRCDVTHGIATTKRNMTLTSFDVVSTLLFYFYFFLKCLRCYMYGIASYMLMLT